MDKKPKELYIYNNTVRQLRVMEDPQIERRTERQREINQQVRKNREYASSMNAGYVLFLIIAVVITFGVCTNYLKLVSSVTEAKGQMTQVQEELAGLKSDNEALAKQMEISINPEYIREVAINELGMVYASKDQIVLYDYQESDYVRQYDEIPEAKAGSVLGN